MAIDPRLLILSGIVSSLTPTGLVFLMVTIGLTGVGVYTKKPIFSYVSLGLLAGVFLLNLNLLTPFPVGSVEAVLIIEGGLFEKSIYNLSLIFLPLVLSGLAIARTGHS